MTNSETKIIKVPDGFKVYTNSTEIGTRSNYMARSGRIKFDPMSNQYYYNQSWFILSSQDTIQEISKFMLELNKGLKKK